MKYVKILFAIALVFTMCSAFSLKKDHSKPVYAFGISVTMMKEESRCVQFLFI